MNDEIYLLDSSALMAYIEGEPGFQRVEELLRKEKCLLPWTVLLEITYVTRREQGESEADYRYALVKHISADILWDLDEPILLTAARFKATHTISFADAIIAAYAFCYDAILVHKDPEFEQLARQVKLETLPYK